MDLSALFLPADGSASSAAAAARAASRTALLLLNTAAPAADSSSPAASAPHILAHLWPRCAAYRIVADGAANRLHAAAAALPAGVGGGAPALLPDAIAGDFDSLRRDVARHYRDACGVRLLYDASQDANDMAKCLAHIAQAAAAAGAVAAEGAGADARWTVVVYGAFGGRFDQEMANLHALYDPRWSAAFRAMVLLGADCAACLLPAGRSVLAATAGAEGPLCGLVPLGAAARSVRTAGLHWELAGERCAFGGLLSTSNWLARVYPHAHDSGPEGVAPAAERLAAPAAPRRLERHAEAVVVESSDPIVWTVALHWAAVLEANAGSAAAAAAGHAPQAEAQAAAAAAAALAAEVRAEAVP